MIVGQHIAALVVGADNHAGTETALQFRFLARLFLLLIEETAEQRVAIERMCARRTDFA